MRTLALLSAVALSLAAAGPVLAEEQQGGPTAGSAVAAHQDQAGTTLAEADEEQAAEPKDGAQDEADSDGETKPESGAAESDGEDADEDAE